MQKQVFGVQPQQQQRMPRAQPLQQRNGQDMRNMSGNAMQDHHARLVQQQQLQQQLHQHQASQQPDQPATADYHTHEPTGCTRAKRWSPEVEQNFRFQENGYRDEHDYCKQMGPPSCLANGWVKKIKIKKNGYFTYFGKDRACVDKYVNKVKLYKY